MERIVEVTHEGCVYTCRAEIGDGLVFWRVDTEWCASYHSPLRALGNEQPPFFRELARLAAQHHGLSFRRR